MLLKGLYHNFYLRIAVFILLTIAGTYLVLQQEWCGLSRSYPCGPSSSG